jgi:hypothetical protein
MSLLSDIDARIMATQDEVAKRSLRRDRNSLTPLLRLPTEILSQLFQEVQEQKQPSVLNRLIHLCHALYSLALSTPGLWTYLNSR